MTEVSQTPGHLQRYRRIMPEVSVSQGHLQQKPSRKYLNYRRLGIDKIFLSFGRNEDRGLQGRRLGLYLQRFFEICRVPDFSVPYTDFGARHYSPALRRWLTPDPLSEKYYTSSPYAYCAGDPVNLVDPDGRKIFFVSYSMGAAFSEGMADYLIEQGVPVEALIHFEPYQAARIESNGNMSNVMSIDYQDKQDWVIKYNNGGEMPGSDYHIRTDSNVGWRYVHAHSISRESTWNEVRKYIFDLRNRNAKEQ